MLTIEDGEHWVAALGYAEEKGKFLVANPLETDNVCDLYSDSQLQAELWPDPDQMEEDDVPAYDILLIKPDKRGEPMKIDHEFLRLCERGSEEDLQTIRETLDYLFVKPSKKSRSQSEPAYRLIEEYQDMLVESAWYQSAVHEASKKDLRDFLRDYSIVARCLGYTVGKTPKARESALIDLAVILTIYLNYGTTECED
jgi:hypothetical protein